MKRELIIRKGFCACGCGGRTKKVPQAFTEKGYKRGDNFKFIAGHNLKHWMKTENNGHPGSYKGGRHKFMGYTRVVAKTHPRSSKSMYTFEHILIAEKVLGKYLPEKAVIHHINGNKSDNRNENLVICEDGGYHQTLHRRMRAYKACGHADWRKCRYCYKYDDPKNMYYNPNQSMGYHRECRNALSLKNGITKKRRNSITRTEGDAR
jgi:hypothetical protein